MPASARHIPTETDAFLAWENRQKSRYELVAGVIRLMTGGTVAHNLVAVNIAAAFHAGLRGGPYTVHATDMKVRSPSGAVMYPDVFVRCGPADGNATEVNDPVVIVEVLSPSTRKEDMTDKRYAYQAISTVQHMLFVLPNECFVELATRQPGDKWLSTLLRSFDAVAEIDALGVKLTLAEIYAGTAVTDAA